MLLISMFPFFFYLDLWIRLCDEDKKEIGVVDFLQKSAKEKK